MTHLHGEFKIQGWDEEPVEEHPDGRKLTRATVKRSFEGGLTGESSTEYLMSYTAGEKSARFVGMERLTAELEGETGHLTLALTGVYDGKEAKADWEVVEGSGDGVFEGASGKGSFHAPHGSTGEYKLDVKTLKTDPPLILI